LKICIISTRHSLDDARVVHKEAKSLANAGHDVCLIFSCNERYEYVRSDRSVIAKGAPIDGRCEYMGLKVYGYPKRKGVVGKWRTFLELSRLAVDLRADVYHAHEPDVSLMIAVRAKKMLLKQGLRVLVVHDIHEYPPGAVADGYPRFLKLPVLLAHILWDWLLMKRVDQVFTANNIVKGYALTLNFRMSVDVLYNGPILSLFPQPTERTCLDAGEKVWLCHEGSLPFNRGLREMIAAVHQLRDKVCLKIVGDVYGAEREWLMQEIEDKKLHDTIMITGWLPYEKVGEAINDCHLGLILFRDSINNRLAGPPNKLFNYMNAGLPLLSVDFPEMRQIILDEKCGVLIHDQNTQSIIDAIESLLLNRDNLRNMSENGQRAIRERYSWEAMERKLLLSYQRLSKIFHDNKRN